MYNALQDGIEVTGVALALRQAARRECVVSVEGPERQICQKSCKFGKIGLNHEKVKLQRTLEILGMMDYDGLINLVKSADEFWKFNYI